MCSDVTEPPSKVWTEVFKTTSVKLGHSTCFKSERRKSSTSHFLARRLQRKRVSRMAQSAQVGCVQAHTLTVVYLWLSCVVQLQFHYIALYDRHNIASQQQPKSSLPCLPRCRGMINEGNKQQTWPQRILSVRPRVSLLSSSKKGSLFGRLPFLIQFVLASMKKASRDHNVHTSIVPNLMFSLWSNERIAFRWMCDCAETMSSAVFVCRLYFKYSTYGTVRFFCTRSLELRHKLIYTEDFFSVFLYFLTLKTQFKFDSALGCVVPEHLIRTNPSNHPNEGKPNCEHPTRPSTLKMSEQKFCVSHM